MTLARATTDATTSTGFERILRRGVRAAYQPVVDIEREETVGYEAVARGDAPLCTPEQLYAAAEEAGMTADLDWACRRAAFSGAIDAGLRPPATLFMTVHPATIGLEVPDDLRMLSRRAAADLKIVAVVNERHILAAPAEMLDRLERARDLGWGIALDGVGRDWDSMALLTLVRPDVVRLDCHLIQDHLTPEGSRIARALESYARESGAQLLADGVETSDHLARARALGAHLAQGCRFGWATELPLDASRRRCGLVKIPRPAPIRDETPLEIAEEAGLRMRLADEWALRSISVGLEQEALAAHTPAVVLACFEDAERFTPDAAERYAALGTIAAFVGVFAPGIAGEPVPHVRGVDVPEGHRLGREWAVVVITPAFAGALIARPRDERRPVGLPRRFDYTVTDDRSIVTRVARALARSIVPLAS